MSAHRLLIALVAVIGTAVVVGAESAAAQPRPGMGIANLIVDAPPDQVDDVRLELLDVDGVDVFDQLCAPHSLTWADKQLTWQCPVIPPGTYRLGAAELPEGAPLVAPTCIRIGTQVGTHIEMRVGPDHDGGEWFQWTCYVTATPPVIMTSTQAADGAAYDPRLAILDEAGSVVDVKCVADDRYERSWPMPRWCLPLADGSYTVVLADDPNGFVAAVWCNPRIRPGSHGGESRASVVISPEQWFWSCHAEVSPQIRIEFGGDADLVDSARILVVGSDGPVEPSPCSAVDASGTGEDGVVHCLGLEHGAYRVLVAGEGFNHADNPSQECEATIGPESSGSCEFRAAPRPSEPSAAEQASRLAVERAVAGEDAQPELAAVATSLATATTATETTPTTTTTVRDDTGPAAGGRSWARIGLVGLVIGLVYSVVVRPRIRSKSRGSSPVR